MKYKKFKNKFLLSITFNSQILVKLNYKYIVYLHLVSKTTDKVIA